MKKLLFPLDINGESGRGILAQRLFLTTRYLSFVAIGLSFFGIAVSLFSTFTILALFTAGTE